MINPFRTTEADVLREFIADVEAAGLPHVAEDWPDLLGTYQRAREILGQPLALRFRVYWQTHGGHVHVRWYSGKAGATYALNGEMTFAAGEWAVVRPMFEASGVEIREEGAAGFDQAGDLWNGDAERDAGREGE